MAVREYIGARYVPKFSDVNGGDWDNSYTYEALEIVKNGNDYYTAKKPVPIGIDISDTEYWVLTGNYNGAISNLQNQINDINNDLGDVSDLDTTASVIVDAINEINSYANEEYINIKKFGAVGDAITDDTQAFKDAIAYMQTNKIGIFIPKGEYRITDTLATDDTKPPFLKIRGEYPTQTVIRYDKLTGNLFEFITTQSWRDADVGNFTLINLHPGTNNPIGISLNRITHSRFHDIIFRNFTIGFYATMSWCMVIERCHFREKNPIAAQAYLWLDYQCNVWHIRNCTFGNPQGVVTSAISLSRAQTSIKIEQCTVERAYGISLTGLASDSAPLSCIEIDSCYFEYMEGPCVRASINAYNLVDNVSIHDCYLNALASANVPAAIDLRYVKGQIVKNNYFTRFTTQMLDQSASGTPKEGYDFCGNVSENGIPFTTTSSFENAGSAAAAPNSGRHHTGEIVYSTTPTSGSIGWVCTSGGTPGTWVPFG